MDVAYLEDDTLHLRTESNLKDFLHWVREEQPGIVAVDAPSKTNVGLVLTHRELYSIPEDRYENFRIAEVLLKQKGIGLYNTPQENPPEWMKRGWDLYSLLQDVGYGLLDTPGTIQPVSKMMFEVHPHASFVVGLGWIPQNKQTLAASWNGQRIYERSVVNWDFQLARHYSQSTNYSSFNVRKPPGIR